MPEKKRPKNRIFTPSDFGEVIQVERLIAAGQNKPYRRLEAKHGFKIRSAIPITQLRNAIAGDLPEQDRHRLQNFVERRWPQVEGQFFSGSVG